jgi:hypothetical protein
MSKVRLSASVDADLIDAAEEAVADGRAESVSAWVNDALRRQRDHHRRLKALTAFVVSFEELRGVISPEEVEQAVRRARGRAVPIRSAPATKSSAKRRRPSA